jgi:hypothetical protein
MCPVCMASVALMAAGATSTGGLTALAAAKLFRKKKGASLGEPIRGEVDHDKESNRESTRGDAI